MLDEECCPACCHVGRGRTSPRIDGRLTRNGERWTCISEVAKAACTELGQYYSQSDKRKSP
jgi:hypothetical protein